MARRHELLTLQPRLGAAAVSALAARHALLCFMNVACLRTTHSKPTQRLPTVSHAVSSSLIKHLAARPKLFLDAAPRLRRLCLRARCD